jgi:hypothetical protein
VSELPVTPEPGIHSDADADADPRPLPPREPELEDCCGTGCVNCVFDMYQIARENYELALAGWLARHPKDAR